MSEELHMGNSSQGIIQGENLRAKDTAPPNVTVIHQVYNKEVLVRSMVLQAKELADKVIVVDNSIKSYRYNDRWLEGITFTHLLCLHGSFENLRIKVPHSLFNLVI